MRLHKADRLNPLQYPLLRLAYQEYVIATNPLLYYRLGELSGTSCRDYSKHGYTGTYSGTLTLAQPGLTGGGFGNRAVAFANTGQVAVSSVPAAVSAVGFSIAGWITRPAGVNGGDRIISRSWNTAGQDGWILFWNINNFANFGISNGVAQTQAIGSNVLSRSPRIHLLVGTYDAVNLKCYVDGQLAATTNAPGLSISNTLPLITVASVMTDTATEDDVALWNRPLSAGEINGLWNAGRTLNT